MGTNSERTSLDPSGPVTLRETGLSRIGRGCVLAGKYRLEMLLGQGGMGFVWSAYNLELELPVAIKLLRTGKNSPQFAERLRFEARAAARLVHPSIVRVFDVALTDGGDPFIVMELLTGETLADALRRGPLSGVRAVQLLLPIADALALAHAHGIVHRDLKPDNVFLSTDGERLQPKLLDFGIAKLGHSTTPAAKLTEDGIVLGSPHYMSPEQVSGEDVDHRSDIWSFCVLLYKVLTGFVPFDGADKRAVMDSILRDEPAPLPAAAEVDGELARLLRSGIRKDPAQRPGSIRELARELAHWLLSQGVVEDANGTSLSGKWLVAAARPTVPCGPLATGQAEHDTDPQVRTFTSQPPVAPQRAQPMSTPAPRRRRSREVLAALALLFVTGGLAWADSARAPEPKTEPALGAAREPPPAPASSARVSIAAPAPRPMSKVAAPTAAAAPSSSTNAPPPRAAPAKARPRPERSPAPQLPF